MDLFLAAALLLLSAGVVASFIPVIPGPILSLIGLGIYWWSTGFTQPGLIATVFIALLGVTAVIIDLAAGFIGAKAADASHTTALAAGLTAVILIPFTGPLGILIGAAVAAVLLERNQGKDLKEAFKTGLYTVAGMLASSLAGAFLTGLMLAVFVASVLL